MIIKSSIIRKVFGIPNNKVAIMFQSAVGKTQRDAHENQQQSSHKQAREAESFAGNGYGNQALLRMRLDGAMPPVTSLRPSQTAMLQRKYSCNETPKDELEERRIQPKLAIGLPNDSFEQEADRVADQVLRITDRPSGDQPVAVSSLEDSTAQRKCAACEEEEKKKKLQTKRASPVNASGELNAGVAMRTAERTGMPLPTEVRSYFEPRFGRDFSKVRVHTDTEAAHSVEAIDALAFTHGQDMVFGPGQFDPASTRGRRLIAHELTHVVQQSGQLNRTPHIQRDGKTDTPPKSPTASPDADAKPSVPATKGQVTLSGFGFGGSELTEEHKKQLDGLKTQIAAQPLASGDAIQLVGHTDQVGTVEKNLELGLNRAKSVQNWMTANLPTQAQVKVASLGEGFPAVAAKNPEQTQEPANRRVEIHIQRTAPAATPAPASATPPSQQSSVAPRPGPLATPPIPGPDLSIDPRESAKKDIGVAAEFLLKMKKWTPEDPIVDKFRWLFVKMQPFLPDDEATKEINKLIGTGTEEGIKAAAKKVLETIVGKSANEIKPGDDPSHSGAGPESARANPTPIIPAVPIPFDMSGTAKPVTHTTYDIKDLPKTITPEGFINLTLIVPDKFDPEQPPSKYVLIFKKGDPADAEPIMKQKINAKPKKNQISMSIVAPKEPGQYVIKVKEGFYIPSDPASEITVEKQADDKPKP